MRKQKIIMLLLTGLFASLFVSACASATSSNVIIPGNATVGVDVKFQQIQAPYQTLSFTTKNIAHETQILSAKQLEKVEHDVATIYNCSDDEDFIP